MNRFGNTTVKPHTFRRILASVLALGTGIGILLFGVSAVSDTAGQSYTESLQMALRRSAVHCYAMEGCYPESLDYLKEHYAIDWDAEQYVVDYEIVGSNRMPVITVIPLNR